VTKFQELKLGHKMSFIVYKLNAGLTEVEVEKTGAPVRFVLL
jgi:hypothetical protein